MRTCKPWIALAAIAALPLHAGRVQAQQDPAPLSLDDALGQSAFAGRTPMDAAGGLVAVTVQDPNVHVAQDGWTAFTCEGTSAEMLGSRIWLADLGSSWSRPLTEASYSSWGGRWSPDGLRLAYFSDQNGRPQLWIWNREAGTSAPAADITVRAFWGFEVPEWTPDGRHVVVRALPAEEEARLRVEPCEAHTATADAGRRGRDASHPDVVVHASPDLEAALKASPAATASGADDRYDLLNDMRADLVRIEVGTGRVDRLAERFITRAYWVSPDGRSVAYLQHEGVLPNSQQNRFTLRVRGLRPEDGPARVLADSVLQQYGIEVAWSPDATALAYVNYGQLVDDAIHVVTLDGTAANVSGDRVRGRAYRPPRWSGDGQRLYYAGNGGVWTIDVAAKRVDFVGYEGGEGMSVIDLVSEPGEADEDSTSLVVSVRRDSDKGYGFARLDLESAQFATLYAAPMYLSSRPLYGTLVHGNAIVFQAESATEPPELWTIARSGSAASRQRRPLTGINRALAGRAYGEARVVRWRSAAGSPLEGTLVLPSHYQAGRAYPLLVDVYGGSSPSNNLNRFGVRGYGLSNAQLFATQGYAVFLPDMPMGRGAPVDDIVGAVVPGVDHLIEAGIADPSRIGVKGWSYGGYSVLALITGSDRFAAAEMGAGFGNLISAAYGRMNPLTASSSIGYVEQGQGGMDVTLWDDLDRYIRNSPFFQLNRVEAPVLIVHGHLDSAVPEHLGSEVFLGLRRLNKTVMLVRYMNEDHSIERLPNVRDYWNRSLGWFDRYLKRP